jgi:hypothetical protein
MKQGDGPDDVDETLQQVLGLWDADEMPAGARERLLARYRQEFVPWWRRLAWTPMRIALPVAVSLLLVGAAVFTIRSGSTPAAAGRPVVPTVASNERPPAPRGSLAGFQPMDEVTATVTTESP